MKPGTWVPRERSKRAQETLARRGEQQSRALTRRREHTAGSVRGWPRKPFRQSGSSPSSRTAGLRPLVSGVRRPETTDIGAFGAAFTANRKPGKIGASENSAWEKHFAKPGRLEGTGRCHRLAVDLGPVIHGC